jgi:hypothetical protein
MKKQIALKADKTSIPTDQKLTNFKKKIQEDVAAAKKNIQEDVAATIGGQLTKDVQFLNDEYKKFVAGGYKECAAMIESVVKPMSVHFTIGSNHDNMVALQSWPGGQHGTALLVSVVSLPICRLFLCTWSLVFSPRTVCFLWKGR